MTAGNYGTPEPENDDPFAYLYHSEGDASGSAAGQTVAQPGVPRTSYNQVKRIGERQYGNAGGGGTAGGGYGYPPQAPTQQTQQYGAQQQPPQPPQPPQAAPGGRRAARGGSGGGPNNKGLLIGAVAVVAVVAIIIVVVMNTGSGVKTTAGSGSSPSATGGANSAGPSQSATSSSSDNKAGALPGTTDAATLQLGGTATIASDVKGAQASGGKYVSGMETVGASASWTFDAPEKGAYTLFVKYGVPGTDATSTLTINGEKRSQALSMKNYAKAASGDSEKGWTTTWAWIDLNKGQNTVQISCDTGNQCNFFLDQVSLKQGQVRS